MARVHLFSSTPHNEKRRRLSNTTATSLADDNDSNDSNKRTNAYELSRLAQLNQAPLPTLLDDTHTLDVTAVPSPSTTHTTSANHSPTIATPQNAKIDTTMNESPPVQGSVSGRSETTLPAALLQNATSDIDLVNAFAAALSGKPESLQMIWDKVRRSSVGNGDGGQQQGDMKDKEQVLGPNNAETVDQEAAATALQLLGLASSAASSATKRPSVEMDKSQIEDSTNKSNSGIPGDIASSDGDTANATAAAAAAVLRQALAQQQQQQQHQQNSSNQQNLQTQQLHSDNNNNNGNMNTALSATMLLANYPGLTSSAAGAEGLELQEEIMQDYKRGTWTREEDELLLMGIKRFGYGRWKEIASTIPGRKGKQLKQRWDNTLASKYVDAELLQNKLRHDDQITKLQHHLEELATGRLSTTPSTSTINSSPSMQTTATSSSSTTTPSLSDHTKSSTPAIPRAEHADWTEIAHKITEKVREGDQEAIEALLSQALLGTSHSLESTQPPAKREDHINTSNTPSPPPTTNTMSATAPTQASTEVATSGLEHINYGHQTTPVTTIAPTTNLSAPTSAIHPAPATTADTNSMNATPGTSPSHQHNASVLNYADAAAFSLYQQLSQQQHTANDNDSNGTNNPLATIQALASNQYFLSNLFANVENGGNDSTNAALAAAAAAAAAAMAQAAAGTSTSTSGTATDASSLLASTMRNHLNAAAAAATTHQHGGNTLMHTGTNNTKQLNNGNHRDDHSTMAKHHDANVSGGSGSPSSKTGLTSQHKRRRSDPALADTQSEAMSIYASSAPVTTMVNNQPQTVYPCLFPNCGKAFARLYNLKSHSRTHTDDRPFNCQLCNTAFSRNHDLKRHLKTHVGEKPYKCAGCQKTFSRLDALKRHKSNARNQAVCLDA